MTSSMEEETTPSSTAARGRMRTAVACDECRRRKLRCDGQRPQCRICQQSGLICEATHRTVRGPKKGDLKALRSRVVQLESMLEDVSTQQQEQPQQQYITTEPSDDMIQTSLAVEDSDLTGVDYTQAWLPSATTSAMETELFLPSNPLLDLGQLSQWPLESTSPFNVIANVHVTDMMRAELDQLFFDRVHPSIPILHQKRYLTWSKSSEKTSAQICLQHVVWTLSTLLSTQFKNLTEPLYEETRQMLETFKIESDDNESYGTELVQAWVLVATCESMLANHRKAWMSAGQAFRLVQGLRLYEIDRATNKNNVSSSEKETLVGTEEKRRVFWMTYILDHILSMRNDWPVTLHDHTIYTRLPAADIAFQTSQNVVGEFLSEAISNSHPNPPSLFNECIILLSVSSRSLLCRQKKSMHNASEHMKVRWTDEQSDLGTILNKRLEILSQRFASPTETHDPLLLFAHILGQAAAVYHYKEIVDSTSNAENTTEGESVEHCYDQTLTAIQTLIRLATPLRELHFSKIHPLMPLPLFLTAEFLYDHRLAHKPFLLCLRELVTIFHDLKNVNDHEQSYMDLLPRSCVPQTSRLLSYSKEEHAAS